MDSGEGKGEGAGVSQSSGRPSDLLKIRILSVLLAVTLIAFASYVAVTADIFDDEPPYPSETTPLTIQSWGVTWDWGDAEGRSDLSMCGLEWANMSFQFDINGDGYRSSRSGPFTPAEHIDIADFVVPATPEESEELFHLSWTLFEDDGMTVMDCCFVSDDTNPLEFNRGDRISIVHLVYLNGSLSTTGFGEDATYEITFTAFEDAEHFWEGYGFAVSDGVLYSWVDHGEVDDPLS